MKRGLLLLFALILCVSCIAAASAEVHYMGDWTNADGSHHWAKCIFCEFVMYTPCTTLAGSYESEEFSVCPICGHYGDADGAHIRCKALLYDYSRSPVGDILVMKYPSPFGSGSDVLCAYSVIFEYAGTKSAFDGLINITFKVDADSAFKLIKIDGDEPAAVDYTLDETGAMTFTVEGGCGLYLLKKAE